MNPTIPTASELVQRAKSMSPKLRERAKSANEARCVNVETIREMKDAGFFRILQSKQYGGYEMSPSVFYDVQMELAKGCMSTAWVYGVIAVHNWQMALFDPKASEDVWGSDTDVLIASTYMPKGQVTPVEGGFMFSGRWSFSSGIAHCDWVLLGGLVYPKEPGPPEYRTFLLPKSDFKVEDTWHTLGLKATGSNDIIVDNVFVPEYRTHKAVDGFMGTSPGLATNTAPLYKLPFGQIFVRAVSSAAIGALDGMLDDYLSFTSKHVGNMSGTKANADPEGQKIAAETAILVDELKLVLHRNFDTLMEKVITGEEMPILQRSHFRFQAAQVVDRCALQSAKLLTACGGSGVFLSNPMTTAFVDIQTARGHYANNPALFGKNYGSVLTGEANTDYFI